MKLSNREAWACLTLIGIIFLILYFAMGPSLVNQILEPVYSIRR